MLVYDAPLVDWISMALHKDSLNEVLTRIKQDKPLEYDSKNKANNRRYIEKILREEVKKQFSDQRRPMLEVILNDIDARMDTDKTYKVDTTIKRKKFVSKDNGRGMSLDEILRLLIIPFNTEKEGLEEIGRFGVGFLSTFNYCLQSPKVRIIVNTKTGEEGHHIGFYSVSNSVRGLRMKIKRTRKKPAGTDITIKGRLNVKRELKDYLIDHLKGIPPYKAIIFINNKPINTDSENKWYASPIELNTFGKPVKQLVGFKRESDNKIYLTSQGVLVKQFRSDCAGTKISFPSAVQVVEGRDAFKIDDNYRKGVEASMKAFERYVDNQKKDKYFIGDMVEFIPSLMSAFAITQIKDIPNIDNIREKLLPGKKYVLSSHQLYDLRRFLGNSIYRTAFEALPQSQSYWEAIYSPYRRVIRDMFNTIEKFSPSKFYKKLEEDKSFYPNLHLLPRETYLCGYDLIKLVEVPFNGEECVFEQRGLKSKILYINANHKYVTGDLSPAKVYSVISDYYHLLQRQKRLNNARVSGDYTPEDAEKDILKAAPDLIPTPIILD